MDIKNKKKKENKNKKVKKLYKSSAYRMEADKAHQLGVADSVIVDLPWTDDGFIFQSALTTYMNFRERLNDPFDPNPNIGGNSALYFASWAQFFRRYLVLTTMVELSFVNNEAFPVFIAVAPTMYDVSSSITSNATAANIAELPYASKAISLSAAGGMDREKYKVLYHLPTLSGNKQSYYADTSYGALNNTNPVNQFFLQVAAWAVAGPLTKGISCYCKLIMRTLWTQRNYSTAMYKTLFDFTPVKSDDDSLSVVLPRQDDIPECCRDGPCRIHLMAVVSGFMFAK
jgi:hypothetical protein